MSRKIKDGDRTGFKQDKFRNSRFETEESQPGDPHFGGASLKTSTTLGGPFDENRGRRSADEAMTSRWRGPFENGRVSSWGHRQDWDPYFEQGYNRGNRAYGGRQLDHEGSHFGKGPKGYKRPDLAIFEDVCDALFLSREVDASDIEVEVREGIVYLTGVVPDRRSKRLAEREIELISGVKDVQNLLTFKTEATPDQGFH